MPSDPFLMAIVTVLIQQLSWGVHAILIIGWVYCSEFTRRVCILLAATSILLVSVNHLIGVLSPPGTLLLNTRVPHLQHSSPPLPLINQIAIISAFALIFWRCRGFRGFAIAHLLLLALIAGLRIGLGMNDWPVVLASMIYGALMAGLLGEVAGWFVPAVAHISARWHEKFFAWWQKRALTK
ncbi:hypothetical protein [Paludibacterium sp. B53371]|uniref:hypothetical protein n=1 Tax=Paludibacterium sp. B53371 TaxID=2806263 RepID=UPI001C044F94|nr:hypothetical protein [Paludibacterium sp. B53371]